MNKVPMKAIYSLFLVFLCNINIAMAATTEDVIIAEVIEAHEHGYLGPTCDSIMGIGSEIISKQLDANFVSKATKAGLIGSPNLWNSLIKIINRNQNPMASLRSLESKCWKTVVDKSKSEPIPDIQILG